MDPLAFLTDQFNSSKCAIFCGAGISYNSGVPLVQDIKKKILSSLPIDLKDTEVLLNCKMPFELFMECLVENTANPSILDLFALGNPNNNHVWIAELAKKGLLKIVVTTNFDELIESALNTNGVSYQLIYREDQFDSVDWEGSGLKVIKIHGSIHDRLNIAVTIKKVSGRELVHQRNKVIQGLLNNKQTESVLFMGYSCSDIFDISPTIENAPSKKTSIYYLEHDRRRSFPEPFKPVKEKADPNPFVDFSGFMTTAKTEDFVKAMADELLGVKLKDEPRPSITWEPIVEVWLKEVFAANGAEFGYYLVGQLLVSATFFELAISYFEQGLSLAKKSGNDDLHMDFLYALGRSYHGLQTKESIPHALDYLQKGLDRCGDVFPKKKCSMMLSMGIIYMENDDYISSINYYTESFKLARLLSDGIIVGKCIGNIGIALKNIVAKPTPSKLDFLYQVALVLQNISLDVSIDQGDKRSEGRTYGNIATLFSLLDQKPEAIAFEEKALEIAVDLSDVYHQGIWNNNLGEDYMGIDDKKAMKYLRTAAKIFRENKWKKFLKTCNQNIKQLLATRKIK